ncbi:hypothetical protein K3369_02545 [Pseudomonas mandelii]|uniref:hypothetical protein n=1 Tax=Pseudomonas mandelii TaxID=75612 RepID=UPI001C832B7B|nr:hypothetical protein [Pseudomonas mandelii]QZA98496.1 hypothetical protein K3369_02545 [Pseudomonas mandelii]
MTKNTDENHERLNRSWILMELKDLGIRKLNIQEAAELIACDMWNDGEIELSESDGKIEDGASDQEIRAALSGKILTFITLLSNAIELGRITPEKLTRDFDERIIPESTFIDGNALAEWLSERGRDPGDVFWEWDEAENQILRRACEEMAWLRSGETTPFTSYLNGVRNQKLYAEKSNDEQLKIAFKSATLEISRLRTRLSEVEIAQRLKIDEPAPPRARRTLLTLIAALCSDSNIDIGARGTAQRIKKMTEEIGAPVDDETIRKILIDIPDALEARMR